MGVILCKKHGKQGFYEVCSHIHEEYSDAIFREHFELWLSDLYFILICENCWNEYKSDELIKYSEMPDDEFFALDNSKSDHASNLWHKVYESIGRRGWCAQCVAEIQIKTARRNDQADPFPVFERTLTKSQAKTIGKLHRLLKENFCLEEPGQFAPHFYKEGCYAFHVEPPDCLYIIPGAFTYPMTITIIGITSDVRCLEIESFVNDFLKDLKQNQAKIIFREKERWDTFTNPQGTICGISSQGEIKKEVSINC